MTFGRILGDCLGILTVILTATVTAAVVVGGLVGIGLVADALHANTWFTIALLVAGVSVFLIGIGIGAAWLWSLVRRDGGVAKRTRGADAEETRMMQDIHRGLVRMEERIDALETILLSDKRDEAELR